MLFEWKATSESERYFIDDSLALSGGEPLVAVLERVRIHVSAENKGHGIPQKGEQQGGSEAPSKSNRSVDSTSPTDASSRRFHKNQKGAIVALVCKCRFRQVTVQ